MTHYRVTHYDNQNEKHVEEFDDEDDLRDMLDTLQDELEAMREI